MVYWTEADYELHAGTFEHPIVVRSAGEELQCGCTGVPADSHFVRWCVVGETVTSDSGWPSPAQVMEAD
jgi:hypothetical protein